MSKGKREAASSGWHTGGNPFGEETKTNSEKKNRSGKQSALITMCCVAAVALVVAGAWMAFVKPPDVSDNDKPGISNGQTNGQQDGTKPGGDQLLEGAGRKENYYTFLLLGKDTGGGGNTDTMILVSYDVTNQVVNAMSIPRDTMINVDWNIKKINAVYASSRGIEGLKEEVGYLTGVTPDFYVAVEWEAIGKIVDALDGVWFDVPYNMDYDDPYQDLYIHQAKGYRLLNGDDAMQVIRWRKNNGEEYGIGDSGRQQVQQDFLKAVAAQCLQLKNWTKVSEFANIFFKNVETDISLNNLLWFAQQAMGMDMEHVTFHTLPGNDQGWYYTPSIRSNLAYFFAYPEEIVPLVNEHFNPYSRDITEDDLQIVYKNKDASLGVTNGTLADPDMAIPSVKPKDPKPSTDSSESAEDEPVLPDEGAEELPDGGDDTVTDGSDGTLTDDGIDGEGETQQPSDEPEDIPQEPSDMEEPLLPPEPELPNGGGDSEAAA